MWQTIIKLLFLRLMILEARGAKSRKRSKNILSLFITLGVTFHHLAKLFREKISFSMNSLMQKIMLKSKETEFNKILMILKRI